MALQAGRRKQQRRPLEMMRTALRLAPGKVLQNPGINWSTRAVPRFMSRSGYQEHKVVFDIVAACGRRSGANIWSSC